MSSLAVACTKRLEWDAGHRVLNHESKCKHLHGHRYAAEISVASAELDELGRVIDFGAVKEVVGKWIDENWDHNLMLNKDDMLAKLYRCDDYIGMITADGATFGELDADSHRALFAGKDPYIMPNGNPTAENIAVVLFDKASELLEPRGVQVVQVRIYETPTCWADACPFEE